MKPRMGESSSCGERGSRPGMRLCSAGIASASAGEEEDGGDKDWAALGTLAKLGGAKVCALMLVMTRRGAGAGGARDKTGEIPSISVSSVGEPGIVGISVALLKEGARRVFRGGGARPLPTCGGLPMSLLPAADRASSESMLNLEREMLRRCCGRPARGRIGGGGTELKS